MRLKTALYLKDVRTVTVNGFTYHLLECSLNKRSSFLVSEISNHPVSDGLQTKLLCKTNRKQKRIFQGPVASTQVSRNCRSTTHRIGAKNCRVYQTYAGSESFKIGHKVDTNSIDTTCELSKVYNFCACFFSVILLT